MLGSGYTIHFLIPFYAFSTAVDEDSLNITHYLLHLLADVLLDVIPCTIAN